MTPSCPVYAGRTPCLDNAGHPGPHWTTAGIGRITWTGTEPYSRDTSRTGGRKR